jgi:hypothetical protein
MTNGMIAGNYIYGINPSVYHGGATICAIYLDNGSCYKTVQSNICDRIPEAFFASNPPNYSNTFQQNFYNSPLGSISAQNNLLGNTFNPDPDWPGYVLSLMTLAGLEAGYRDIDPLAVPGNLVLQNARLTAEGMFAFDLVSSPNAIVALETSLDLASWQVGVTNLLQSGNRPITNARTNGGQFYRARQLQP